MKRSRACEDLRALEWATPATTTTTGYQRLHKRSKQMIDSGDVFATASTNSDLLPRREELETLDAIDLVMSSYATSVFDECMLPPIRRNSRDVSVQVECCDDALQFKKKLQLAASEPMMEPTERDLLVRSRFQIDTTRCIDSLDTRQSIPFDMSSFIMLSINPKR
jgi:hypothetical protein|uniref:Uncharacterized protein n=1 Tax=Globisporangium ultimum (strain ATCC 200006 / CBS 805.95 / DAOM BR144) TaxID=431595 RepID=K3W4Z2_GLOUD